MTTSAPVEVAVLLLRREHYRPRKRPSRRDVPTANGGVSHAPPHGRAPPRGAARVSKWLAPRPGRRPLSAISWALDAGQGPLRGPEPAGSCLRGARSRRFRRPRAGSGPLSRAGAARIRAPIGVLSADPAVCTPFRRWCSTPLAAPAAPDRRVPGAEPDRWTLPRSTGSRLHRRSRKPGQARSAWFPSESAAGVGRTDPMIPFEVRAARPSGYRQDSCRNTL